MANMTVPEKKILIVSYLFPPSLAARALQLGKLVKYLLRMGAKIEVVTSACSESSVLEQNKQSSWLQEHPNLLVHALAPQSSCLYDSASSFLKGLPFQSWTKMATQKVLSLLQHNGADYYHCIMSCAHPMDSHVATLAIKSKYPEMPWLVHFSDPWAKNPFDRTGRWWQRGWRAYLEGMVMDRADRILFVSDELREYVMGFHPTQSPKASTLVHVYDPELYGCSPCDGDRFCITYVGGFSNTRHIGPLVDVFQQLKDRGINLAQVRLNLVGKNMEQEVEAINSISPGLAGSPGQVEYTRSLEIMTQSDLLLLIDANLESSPFFPSKLADYIGARRPIMGISPENSCSTGMLKKLGMPVFDYDHLTECADYLQNLFQRRVSLPEMCESQAERYAAGRVAEEYLELLTSLDRK